MPFEFDSRRSAVLSGNAMVATSQPLACTVGIDILKAGGNAADAGVAMMAALNVVEPCSTGIGGDCFCLFYDAKEKTVRAINASGRSPKHLTIESLREKGYKDNSLPPLDVNCVTVPGAPAGWVDIIEKFGSGKKSLSEVFQGAITLAEEGYPVSPVVAQFWEQEKKKLQNAPNGNEMLFDGQAPKEGDFVTLPNLGKTFRLLATEGKKGFYEGPVAEAIVKVIQDAGGALDLQDLKEHESEFCDPISTDYEGLDVWECPPNGQGICVLIALNILSNFDFSKIERNSTLHIHLVIEALRLAFADVRTYVCDPDFHKIPKSTLLSKSYAKKRAAEIKKDSAILNMKEGKPLSSSDTAYLSVVDKDGNACSLINSNYMGFGSGIVAGGFGFTLQNRGSNFSLDENNWNSLEPGKRSYHTIMPGMVTKDNDLWASFGVMGAFMQPQGQVQVLLNMIHFGMNSQEALDANRICIPDGEANSELEILLEPGLSAEVLMELKTMGHNIKEITNLIPNDTGPYSRSYFGRGQIIRPTQSNGRTVLTGGSDPRADGQVIGM